jgi:hypothetical protein
MALSGGMVWRGNGQARSQTIRGLLTRLFINWALACVD